MEKPISPGKRNELKFYFLYLFLCLEEWEGSRIKIFSNLFYGVNCLNKETLQGIIKGKWTYM